jgi:hypothetical protein
MGFVVGEEALGEAFFQSLLVSPHHYHCTIAPYAFVYYLQAGQWIRRKNRRMTYSLNVLYGSCVFHFLLKLSGKEFIHV